MTSANRDLDSMAALNPSTLAEILRWRALHQPDQLAYTFLVDGEDEEVALSYRDLDHQARMIGAQLQREEAKGARALLLYPPGLDYIAAFFGCLYAGIVAVPAYPPDPARLNRTLPRLQAIMADAQATLVLTTAPLLAMAELLFDEVPDLKALCWIATDTLTLAGVDEWRPPLVTGDDLAFLQYTSGSTAAPRGVMLSHNNLLHNSALIHECFGMTPQSRGVIWLPPYHDMGLIGGILQPLHAGIPVVLLSPIDFLKRPLRWLKAISYYKGTISGGPSFAYDLCVRKISPEERAQLDLSSWELAFNGAEPVRAETLARFAEAFAPCGFRPEAFYPCYGLAEATLIVSGGAKTVLPVTRSISRVALQRDQIEFVTPLHPAAQEVVSCGHTLTNQEIVIADPETLSARGPGQIGEIWVAGPSVAQGYWHQPEKTAETFGARLTGSGAGPFLRTGDLGFLQDGELFVTGRLKDLIIIRGHNHYPQDIEYTVEKSHPILRPGCCAVFSISVADEERLIITQEVGSQATDHDFKEAIQAIRRAVAEHHELQVYAVWLLAAGSIPKTSSGKIQRHACREGFLAESLPVVAKDALPIESAQALDRRPEETLILKALRAVSDPAARHIWLTLYLQEQIARVLKIAPSQVDPQQSVGALGLDSLTAVELAHAVETDLGVVLPLVDFLQGLTIPQLVSRLLLELDAPATTRSLPLATAKETTSEQPLSYGQRAMWFLHRLDPTSAAYHIARAVRLSGELDLPALQLAFQMLAERHPSLRTTFPVKQGEPVQYIHDRAEVYFQVEDASTWNTTELDQRLSEEAQRPFDLEQGPLLRVGVFRRSEREHILLLTVHHIIADFWSLAILVRELGMLYPANKKKASTSLAPLTYQYADYTRWQTETLSGAEGERLWSYWRKKLAGELPLLNLPTDHPRPAVQTSRGASRDLQLSADLARKLKALGQAHDATFYTTLLAAFQVLLHRHTGQTDVLVGSPAAGRNRAGLADLVGYFVNPVVIRGDLSGQPTFSTFLDRMRRSVLDTFACQEYAFNLLVERLRPARDPSRTPIFQAWFTLQQSPLSDMTELAAFAVSAAGTSLHLGDLALESIALEQHTAQFDLALSAAETSMGLSVSLQYNRDLFEAATIDRMLGHFQTLLEGIVTDPDRRLSELPLLPAAEQRQVLHEWNATEAEYDRQICLPQLFEAQAQRIPPAPAVVFEDRQLSYRELDRRANQLAHYLQRLGVGPDVLVAICMERTPEMLIGLLGILKAGGAYLPLDPAHPRDRLAYILEDSGAPLLLTQGHFAWPQPDRHVIDLDIAWTDVARESEVLPARQVCAENLAYTIYTSGSTGRPKGVQISQRAVVNFLNTMRQRPGLTEQDVLLSVTTLSFDIAGLELFLPLTVGAVVNLASQQVIADGQALAALLDKSGASVMQATPATWRLLLESGWPGNSRLRALCGGEALSRDLADRLLEKTAAVWNMYGPTETTIWSTTCRIEPDQDAISIGRPIANTQIYVLDLQLNPVPIGVVGELYIGGDGLARGYLNRPALTAERFIPQPFSSVSGARLYRTGDVARYLPNGNLEVLGRVDHQVKIRGYRIELSEIETVLRLHADVREAVVLAREDAPDHKQLVAYIVPNQKQVTTNDLRSFLKETLPDYMLPSIFMTLETLPLTPNGKVDRQALPVPDGQRPALQAEYVMPQTPIEQRLVTLWQSVLQVKQVGIHDNFFDLGGHSLLMTKIHSQLQEEGWGQDLSIVELFQYPTVHALAKYLSKKDAAELDHERIGIRQSRGTVMQQQKERRRALRSTL